MKKLIIIISILLLATPLFAADYYVDFTGGLDSNPGTSSGQAWKTIAKVYSKMPTFQQGDNILFKRGETWAPGTDQDGLMVTCVGASGNHIKFGAYGTGPKPKISFKGETGDGRYSGVDEVCIYISSQSGYITIENFQLEGAANNMAVEFTGVGSPRAPIYIDYCDISGDGYSSEALVANNFSDNSRVSHCTFDATNVYSKAVEVKVGSGVVVSDCVINGYTNAGGIRYSNHANNGIIERNYIYNPMTDLAWAIVYRSADHGGVIRNNLIDMRGTTLSDKNLRGITGWLGTNGREVYNNTIIGDGHGSAFKVEDLGWIIKNNLVINVYTVFNISSLGGVTGGYNAYYNCTTYLDNDNVFNELGHNVTTDPLISDVTPDDPEGFKINEGSPCINAGINDDSDIPSEDYFGNTRIGSNDIGAHENIVEAPAAPTNLKVKGN